MTLGCLHCSFGYTITPPRAILSILADPDLPEEDYWLWIERFVRQIGLHEYQGVLVHTGRMHKGDIKGFMVTLSDQERKLFERDSSGTSFTGHAH